MAELTPSRIEPLGGSPDSPAENPNRQPGSKQKAVQKPAPAPPPIDADREEEAHQLDEQA